MATIDRRSRARAKPAATKKPAGPKRTKHWRTTFLAVLAETSNVTQSAKAAVTSLSKVYETRRKDAEFRQQWHAALCEGYDYLEMEVLRRLREGAFTTADGGKFDFACALRVLSAHQATVMAERARLGDEDEDAVFASINAKIDAMRRQKQRERLALPAPTDTRDVIAQ